MDSTADIPDNSDLSTDADQALNPNMAAAQENGAGKQSEGYKSIDEIPYEEAMRLYWENEAKEAEKAAGETYDPDQTPVAEPAAPEKASTPPEPDAGDAAEEEEERETAKRYRIKANSDTDAQILAVMKRNPGMTIMEAIARVSPSATTPENGDQSPPKDETPAADTAPSLADITAEQERVNAAMQQAYADMDFEKAGKLNMESLALVEQKLLAAQREAIAADRKKQEAATEWNKYEDQTAELYPQALDENSDLRKQMRVIHTAMQKAGDPLINNPECTLRIAQMAAAQLAIAPATVVAPVRQTAPAKASPKPTPVRPRPMDGTTSHGGLNPASQAVAVQKLDGLTTEQWETLLASQ